MAKQTYYFETETGGFHFRPSSGPTLELELTDDQVRRLRIFARNHDYQLPELADVYPDLYNEIDNAICDCGEDLSDYYVLLPGEIESEASDDIRAKVRFKWYITADEVHDMTAYITVTSQDVTEIESVIEENEGNVTADDIPDEIMESVIDTLMDKTIKKAMKLYGKSNVADWYRLNIQIILPDNLPFMLTEYKESDF